MHLCNFLLADSALSSTTLGIFSPEVFQKCVVGHLTSLRTMSPILTCERRKKTVHPPCCLFCPLLFLFYPLPPQHLDPEPNLGFSSSVPFITPQLFSWWSSPDPPIAVSQSGRSLQLRLVCGILRSRLCTYRPSPVPHEEAIGVEPICLFSIKERWLEEEKYKFLLIFLIQW